MEKLSNHSLLSKLILPIVLSSLMIIGVIDLTVIKSADQLFEDYVELQSSEYMESFVIATEVASDEANIVRVTNSIGAYSDVKELFIIDDKTQLVIAANKGQFITKPASQLPDYYPLKHISSQLSHQRHFYQAMEGMRYIVAYNTEIYSEDRHSMRPIKIVMLMKPESIEAFFDTFKTQILLMSVLILVASLLLFYGFINKFLLAPIHTLTSTLERQKTSSDPVFCELDSDDELGMLSKAYNVMLLDRYEKRRELINKNEELKQLMLRDALTGVSNRAHFDRKLTQEWYRAIRNHDPLTLIFIDIDYFKQFNDSYGHLSGDECLRQVAQAIRACIQRPADFLGRYGGEEFVILLPNSNDRVLEFAEKCRETVEQLQVMTDDEGKTAHVTISLGVATMVPERGDDKMTLIRAADNALYQAKGKGRNQVVVYQPSPEDEHKDSKLSDEQSQETSS